MPELGRNPRGDKTVTPSAMASAIRGDRVTVSPLDPDKQILAAK